MDKAQVVFEKIGGSAKAGKNVIDKAYQAYQRLRATDVVGKAKMVGSEVGKTTKKVQKAMSEGSKAFKKEVGGLDSRVKGLWADTKALPSSYKIYKGQKNPNSRKAKKALESMYRGAVIPGVAAGTMATGAGVVAMSKK